MSVTYISASLRRSVEERAGECCEYCRVHRSLRMLPYAIDHVIAEKHGGPTHEDNLCLSCYLCNAHKGSDVASVDWELGGIIVALFNPRRHKWDEHFRVQDGELKPLTAEARVTLILLHLNDPERVSERQLLIAERLYPC